MSEPVSDGVSRYPHNAITETASGHIIEYDDTPGNERINLQHRTGTKIEMRPDGSVFVRAANNSYEIIAGDKDAVIRGQVTVVCESNADIRVRGDTNLQTDGDFNQLVQGNYNLEVQGNRNVRIHGDESTRIAGSSLDETRGNAVRRHLANYRERTVGDHDCEYGGSWTTTVEGEIHQRSYGQFQGSYYGGLITLNGENADGAAGAGTYRGTTYHGEDAHMSTSVDVSGPVRSQELHSPVAQITVTQGNLVGLATNSTYTVNAATLTTPASIAALGAMSFTTLTSDIVGNLSAALSFDLQAQLSSLAGGLTGGIMDQINGAYSSIGGVFTDLSSAVDISNITGAIQGFDFDYNMITSAADFASLGSLQTAVEGQLSIANTAWHTATAAYHDAAGTIAAASSVREAYSTARAALETATALGISEATMAASTAFTNFTSVSGISANVSGFISDLGSIHPDIAAAAAAAQVSTIARVAAAQVSTPISSSTPDSGTITAPTAPNLPIKPTSSEKMVDVTGTSEAFILDLDREPVTGYNRRLLNTYEVVSRCRNKKLRTDAAWLQDQLDSGAIMASITGSNAPRTRRTGGDASASSGERGFSHSLPEHGNYNITRSGLLRITTIPEHMVIHEGVGRSTRLSPNFRVSHMLGADSNASALKEQVGLSAIEIAQNAQLISYNILEPLRDKYRDTWTISEGIYNLLPNEKIDSTSITLEMVQGLGVGVQFIVQPNSFYFDAAQWVRNNLVFDKLVLSYMDYDPSGINEPTLIITVKAGHNARQVSTEFNHVKIADNLLDLSDGT